LSGRCCASETKFEGRSAAYRRVLWLVIGINGGMFLTETAAGWLAGSVALQADALDFLGDSLTYAISLLVIGRAARWRARAALLKSLSLAAMGLWVLGFTAWRVLVLGVPEAAVMGAIGALALAANVGSALLLYRFRDGDANVRSVWLCSRNDAIGNLAVVGAAGLVALTGSGWPDVAVAGAMACLFLASASQILCQALAELASGGPRPAGRASSD
jgi:Co/Zn/Cd efflux system component